MERKRKALEKMIDKMIRDDVNEKVVNDEQRD